MNRRGFLGVIVAVMGLPTVLKLKPEPPLKWLSPSQNMLTCRDGCYFFDGVILRTPRAHAVLRNLHDDGTVAEPIFVSDRYYFREPLP
jgi:hypothetical protein